MDAVEEVFRPGWGRVLCVLVALVCATSIVVIAVTDGWRAWAVVPPLTLVAGACWALFWRPAVIVSDGGVRLVNVLRTIELPWPSIERIDTKWALTLFTVYGKFTAWAAPAPGAREAVRGTKRDAHLLPDSAWTAEGSRPGDLPSTASGSAALLIRRRWEALSKAGHLDEPRIEWEEPPVEWHVHILLPGGVLLLLSILGVLA
jgi:hypothetical protein